MPFCYSEFFAHKTQNLLVVKHFCSFIPTRFKNRLVVHVVNTGYCTLFDHRITSVLRTVLMYCVPSRYNSQLYDMTSWVNLECVTAARPCSIATKCTVYRMVPHFLKLQLSTLRITLVQC